MSSVTSAILAQMGIVVDDATNRTGGITASQPVDLRNTAETKKQIVFVSLPNPRGFTKEQQLKLHELILPYTMRAFGETAADMTEKSRQEHFDHVFQGDLLFLAVLVKQQQQGDVLLEIQDKSTLADKPHVVAHELVELFKLDGENDKTLLYVEGICCDPLQQKGGIATALYEFALKSVKPSIVALRTVNPAVVKMMLRTAPPGSKLFPDQCKTEEDWQAAKVIANKCRAVMKKATPGDGYDEEALLFRGAYAEDRVRVFSGGAAAAAKNDDDAVVNPRAARPGDAVFRITVFP